MRRYRSAQETADDLRRFLEGRPILARPVSPVGRMWRWCRRNPKVSVLSVAFVLSLAAGTVVSSVLAIRAIGAEAPPRGLRRRPGNSGCGRRSKLRRPGSPRRGPRAPSPRCAVLGFVRNKVLAAARPKDQEGGLGIDATIRNA